MPTTQDPRTIKSLYDAGLRTYKVQCSDCGLVRGIQLTKDDHKKAITAHKQLHAQEDDHIASLAAEADHPGDGPMLVTDAQAQADGFVDAAEVEELRRIC